LTSSDFADGDEIPREFACDGADEQPVFVWSGVPQGTAELALVMHDPDAGGFVHWVVAGIPPDATELSGELPAGARHGVNDFGASRYDGPCPASGTHTYLFTLLAVSAPLDVGDTPTARAVRQAAQDVTIARAELRGMYRLGD
jgi:Raf kinase inhibitor-like YbhB/YbcL family protein